MKAQVAYSIKEGDTLALRAFNSKRVAQRYGNGQTIFATPDDLISFLKAISDSHLTAATTAAVRYPQWFLLLLAVLGILSGCRSCRDLEAFPSGTGRP